MYRSYIFLALLSSAAIAASQSTTFVSLFFNTKYSNISTAATGYVLDANPTATTYVLNCLIYCDNPSNTEYARITAWPGSQEWNSDDDGTSQWQICSFTSSTEATCTQSEHITDSAGVRSITETITFLPASSVSNVPGEIIETFPGNQAVLITSGVEKLAGMITSTTAGPTEATTSAASQSSIPSGNSTSDATSLGLTWTLGYCFIGLAIFTISL
ncbi:hypothetical protein BX600DRAFT_467056 [Xylariales sp. PMI_506]|nr:hypothetical protein BX600DRAFT_467056 [Xylariales sp. PMI_506]